MKFLNAGRNVPATVAVATVVAAPRDVH
jgi:hypothetical protein